MKTNWIDKHSVNCYFCGELEDERNCRNADDWNNNDGGSICEDCQIEKESLRLNHPNMRC